MWIAAEPIRAYVQETNRLNREHRTSADTTRRELSDTEKAIKEIVHVIEQGEYQRALSARPTELEARQDELNTRLSEAPAPGDKRGKFRITLHGDLDTILDWIDSTGKSGHRPAPDTASCRLSVSVKTRGSPW